MRRTDAKGDVPAAFADGAGQWSGNGVAQHQRPVDATLTHRLHERQDECRRIEFRHGLIRLGSMHAQFKPELMSDGEPRRVAHQEERSSIADDAAAPAVRHALHENVEVDVVGDPVGGDRDEKVFREWESGELLHGQPQERTACLAGPEWYRCFAWCVRRRFPDRSRNAHRKEEGPRLGPVASVIMVLRRGGRGYRVWLDTVERGMPVCSVISASVAPFAFIARACWICSAVHFDLRRT